MQTNTYDANKSLSAYYANRDTRNPARLWATEKMLHDLAALGLVEFFEGEGGDPTQLAGYAPGKLWLQVVPGVTVRPGIVRAYDGAGEVSSQASWPEVTRDAWSRLIPIDATDFQVLTGTDIQTLFEETDAALHTAADAFLKASNTSDDLTEGEEKLLMTTGERAKLAKLALASDLTLRIPTDYSTLQAAFDATSMYTVAEGVRIILLVESGHEITGGLTVANGDFGHYIVQSEDASLAVAASFTGRLINATHCVAPTLDAYVDGGGTLERIYSCFGSLGEVTAGSGGENTTGRPLYGNASFIEAGLSEWRDCADSIYFSAGSGAQMGGCIISGFTVTANGTLVASRGSSIEAQGMSMSDCARGIECKRAASAVNCHEATFDNISGFVARASRGATISLEECTATNIVDSALEAMGGIITAAEGASFTAKAGNSTRGCIANGTGRINLNGSTVTGFGTYNCEARNSGYIDVTSATITGAGTHNLLAWHGGQIAAEDAILTGAGTDDARVLNGGQIWMDGATTSSGAAGVPDISDTNMAASGGFNSLGPNGVIWAGSTAGSPTFTAINVGSSDTTLSRASAGDVAVEGNRIFRVGGADVPVADGGTGAGTARGACANLGAWHVIGSGAVAVPLTGSTAETALATISIPAGAMGANGCLRITYAWSGTNSADDKIARVRLGGLSGTSFQSSTQTTVITIQNMLHIHNRNSESSQVQGISATSVSPFSATGGALVTGAVDTSAAVDLVITGQLENSADTITLQHYIVELFYKA